VLEEMNTIFSALDKINREDNLNATAALKKQGIMVIKPSALEIQEWKQYSERSIQNMILSGMVEKSMVDEIENLLTEFRAR
jgi:hypothetical protein